MLRRAGGTGRRRSWQTRLEALLGRWSGIVGSALLFAGMHVPLLFG